MSTEERLAYEARVRTRQAALAGAAGILLIIGVAIQLGGAHVNVNEKTLGLITEHKRATRDLLSAIVTALSLFAVAGTLHWLWGAARARDPKLRPSFMGWMAIAGGVLEGISIIASTVAFGSAASDFVSHGSQTYPEANALLSRASLLIPQIGQYLGVFLLAIALVMVSLNAMRAGLLTRFLGYMGIIAGVLTIIPIVPIPIVEAYWLLAVAYLLSGRWPSGVPPAWSSGRAEPWPARQQLGGARGQQAARGARGARGKPVPTPAPEPVGAPARGNTRSTTPKRKRKRRK